MKIEPKYYIWENTPLKWYKFLVYFALVLGILSQSVYSINILLSGNAHWLDLLYSFISLAWLIFSEVQLANRKWSGAVAYCLYFIFQGVYYFIFTVLYISYGLSFSHLLSNVIAAFILVPILWVYFCKRRPLFSPWVDQHDTFVPTAASPAVENETSAFAEELKPEQPSYSEPEKSRSTPEPDAPSLQQRIMASRERLYRCCPQCGQLVPYIQTKCDCGYRFLSHISKAPKKEAPHQKILTGVLGALCLLLCVALAFSFSSVKSANSELNTLQEDLDAANAELKNLQAEYDGLDGSLSMANLRIEILNRQLEDAKYNTFVLTILVGAVVDSDNVFYHTPQCNIYEDNDGSFFFSTTSLLAELGFSPCPDCHTSDEIIQIYNIIEREAS